MLPIAIEVLDVLEGLDALQIQTSQEAPKNVHQYAENSPLEGPLQVVEEVKQGDWILNKTHFF